MQFSGILLEIIRKNVRVLLMNNLKVRQKILQRFDYFIRQMIQEFIQKQPFIGILPNDIFGFMPRIIASFI